MESIVNLALNELKEELDEEVNATTEPSRLMRFFHLKYKCFIVFFLAIVAMLAVVYMTVKEILNDDEAAVLMTKLFEVYFPNATVTIDTASG
jgi:hypothetical protein